MHLPDHIHSERLQNIPKTGTLPQPNAVAPGGPGHYSPPPLGKSAREHPPAASAASVSERGAAWLAHLSGGQGVGGSNPLAPTIFSKSRSKKMLNRWNQL
jgi:hypothetical protein